MKKLICVISILAVIFSFAACGQDKTVSSSGGQPETSVDSHPNSGGEVSKDVEEPKLNTDLLSRLGLTYKQIKEKHEKLVKVVPVGGGAAYVFDDGFGYGFPIDQDYFNIPVDDNGNWIIEHVPEPKEAIECSIILLYDNAAGLFISLIKETKDADIEKIYGVKHTLTNYDWDSRTYVSAFTFEDKIVCVQTKREGIIEPDSYIFIKIVL